MQLELPLLDMAKYQKAKIMKKKATFGEKHFSMLLWGTKEVPHRKKNEFDHLLLFSKVAGLLAEGIAYIESYCPPVQPNFGLANAMYSLEGQQM